jgi:hypothetical protein
MAGKKPARRPGRPSKLTDEVADRLVALIVSGASPATAAETVGVTPRALRGWRARAWSRDPRDVACVTLERRLQQALASPQTDESTEAPVVEDWTVIAARLEASAPERWGPAA